MKEAFVDFRQAREALERELEVSQRLQPFTREEMNVRILEEPQIALIIKETVKNFHNNLVAMIRKYKLSL